MEGSDHCIFHGFTQEMHNCEDFALETKAVSTEANDSADHTRQLTSLHFKSTQYEQRFDKQSHLFWKAGDFRQR